MCSVRSDLSVPIHRTVMVNPKLMMWLKWDVIDVVDDLGSCSITLATQICFTLLHLEWQKLYEVLAVLIAVGLK